MTFHILTIFPDAFRGYFDTSILARAQKNKKIKIKIYDIRKFTKDKHRTTDDRPFGGGPGMVMKIEPIFKTVLTVLKRIKPRRKVGVPIEASGKTKIILLSAHGKQFTQKMAQGFSKKYSDIVLICGRYEGIDARLKRVLHASGFRPQELSVGPYVLTGGELPAMVVVDTVSRHIKGVLGKEESLEEKKGSYPVYTRPEIFSAKSGKKYRVPKVLLSGNHKKIEKWRRTH